MRWRKSITLVVFLWTIVLGAVQWHPMQLFAQETETKKQNKIVQGTIDFAKSILESGKSLVENAQRAIKPPQKEAEIPDDTLIALSDIGLYSTLTEISSPIAPFSYGRYHVFVHYDNTEDSRVRIAFKHEDFFLLYPFVRLSTNKKILVYIRRLEVRKELAYRLIIDGVWAADPNNKNSTVDQNGIRLSLTETRELSLFWTPSVVYDERTDTLRFSFLIDDSEQVLRSTSLGSVDASRIRYRSVYLVGNFTAWDPFFLKMKPSADNPAMYYVDVAAEIRPYHYYFQVGNYSILDPKNRNIQARRDGGLYVSTFSVIETTTRSTGAKTKEVALVP